jgi:multidrug efflux pump subunit AcrA (membrane-fusion protein)
MTISSLVTYLGLALLTQLGDATPLPSSEVSDPVISNAVVRVAEGIKLSAKEPGVLVHLGVKEGTVVQRHQKIGQIDDSEPQLQKKSATYQKNAAIKRAEDDVEIRFAEKQAEVSRADYEKLEEANRIAQRAVTEVELRQKKLEWDRAILAGEKAIHDRELAKYEAYTKHTELLAAELKIKNRVIIAPWDGIVEILHRKQEEWVNPGDPILELMRLDVMEVDGAVDQKYYDPHELQGCEVTVEVELARGRKETVRGRITKVSAIVDDDKKYGVRAEVANRQEHASWMLRDGMSATMTIHLGTGGAAAAGVTRVP